MLAAVMVDELRVALRSACCVDEDTARPVPGFQGVGVCGAAALD